MKAVIKGNKRIDYEQYTDMFGLNDRLIITITNDKGDNYEYPVVAPIQVGNTNSNLLDGTNEPTIQVMEELLDNFKQ